MDGAAGAGDTCGMPGPTWDMLRDKMRAAQNDLMTKAREFAATLPPGSRVAISAPEHSPVDSGQVRIEWTLRPVFPGQPIPPTPWVTYEFDSPSPGRSLGVLQYMHERVGGMRMDPDPIPLRNLRTPPERL